VKKCAAAILLLLIMAQSFYSATIYIWFQVNRSYITKAFCVNISRPEMKCGGKCYLAKQLQQAEENNPPQQLKEWLETAPFLVSMDTHIPEAPATRPVNPVFAYQEYMHIHSSGIFRPPLS